VTSMVAQLELRHVFHEILQEQNMACLSIAVTKKGPSHVMSESILSR
jgi:hypothetical protein